MGTISVGRLSVEDYLAIDRAAEVKSEYHDGEMFPMEAVRWAHSVISINVGVSLKPQLSKTQCHVAGSSIRVRVSPTKYVLPDLIVVCGKPAFTDEYQDTVTNPKVVIEILSPSTEDYDYGKKFILYRRLPSFEEYVLVSQEGARVEKYRKTPDDHWVLSTYTGLDSVVPLESLSVSLPLSEIYDGIEFPAAAED